MNSVSETRKSDRPLFYTLLEKAPVRPFLPGCLTVAVRDWSLELRKDSAQVVLGSQQGHRLKDPGQASLSGGSEQHLHSKADRQQTVAWGLKQTPVLFVVLYLA